MHSITHIRIELKLRSGMMRMNSGHEFGTIGEASTPRLSPMELDTGAWRACGNGATLASSCRFIHSTKL